MTAHARIKCAIWRDTDFRELTVDAQWTYQRLLSDSSRNHAGVLALTRKRWIGSAAGMTAERLDVALSELVDTHFIVMDEDTEEVLVRSYMRHNDVAAQPNVLKAALRQAKGVESLALRGALAHELRLLPAKPEDTPRMAHGDPHAVAEEIDPGPLASRLSVVPQINVSAGSGNNVKGSANPSENPSGKGYPKGAVGGEVVVVKGGGAGGEMIMGTQLPLAAAVVAPVRPDVESLCEHLHAKLVETDYKPLPKITQQWRDQARLLLDKDERSHDQAMRLVTWALENDFWSTNIASMGKFRQQYPKLLAAARREHAAQQPKAAPPTVRSQRLAATAAMVARLEAEEAAERMRDAVPGYQRKALHG